MGRWIKTISQYYALEKFYTIERVFLLQEQNAAHKQIVHGEAAIVNCTSDLSSTALRHSTPLAVGRAQWLFLMNA